MHSDKGVRDSQRFICNGCDARSIKNNQVDSVRRSRDMYGPRVGKKRGGQATSMIDDQTTKIPNF